MPIVVDEVVITVELTNATGPSGSAGGGSGSSGGDQQALIAECVERVLEVLRQQKEP